MCTNICRRTLQGAFITTAQYGQAYCFGAILIGSSTDICKKYEIFEKILFCKTLTNAYLKKEKTKNEQKIKIIFQNSWFSIPS